MTLPQRLCFAAELSNCNLASCWHIELSILGLVHFSIRIHLRISFSCSMKFFQLKNTLGLALGESWPLLAQPQKNIDVHKGMANLHKSSSAKTRMLTHGSYVECTSTLRQPWEELVPWERTPWHWSKHLKFRPSWSMTLPQRQCFSAQLTTAIFSHVGVLNSAYWAFSSFNQHSFESKL